MSDIYQFWLRFVSRRFCINFSVQQGRIKKEENEKLKEIETIDDKQSHLFPQFVFPTPFPNLSKLPDDYIVRI